MGNSQSVVTDVVNNATMTLTNDFVSKNVLNTSVNSTNVQDLTINIGIADGCPISTVQKISSSVSVKSAIDSTQTKQFASSMQSSLETALDQSSKMVNGLGAMTGGNSQSVSASIRNTINQSVSNRVTSENIMNTAVNSLNIQSGKLNMAVCRNSPISMTQGIESNVVAQNLLTQITDDILNNEYVANTKTTVKQSTDMQNTGFEALFQGLMYSLASLFCTLCILAIVAAAAGGGGGSKNGKGGFMAKIGKH
jgi:hypothetical protein